MTLASRPTGVTIIAILNIIGGIIMLFAGLGMVALGALVPMLPPSTFQQPQNMLPGAALSAIPTSVLGGVGGVIIALGILSFVVAYGLLKGRPWAWTLTIALSIISIALNAISLVAGNMGAIVSIAISGVILYYMYRPHVKEYFGKTVTSSGPASATEA
ncbi:MAG TPA: hypothetical protein VGQ03_02880 [Nitrososphaera sp.]|nr:hypothetical protein [Nitrososphaera sp.]